MKTVELIGSGELSRVDNVSADQMVKSGTHNFVPKHRWKVQRDAILAAKKAEEEKVEKERKAAKEAAKKVKEGKKPKKDNGKKRH